MTYDRPLRITDLNYELPGDLIAQHPADVRDQSRLLVLDRASGALFDSTFDRFPECTTPGDMLILNNTKVLPARFFARRATGGRIEGLFVGDRGSGKWEVMLKGSGRLKPSERLFLQPPEAGDALDLIAHQGGGLWTVNLVSADSTVQVLERLGRTPLPPYIHRDGATDRFEQDDRQRYQTIYAEIDGAIAAPTAGLHFTQETFDQLTCRQVDWAFLTLHVGMGTFAPLNVDSLDDHKMHTEQYELTSAAAERLAECRRRKGRLIAVGTTSARVLETCANDAGQLIAGQGRTDLFIRPPHTFKAVDALLTNFHLPRSTLIALVMAFAGPELIRKAYAHAVENRYRFYSYGDAMLIL